MCAYSMCVTFRRPLIAKIVSATFMSPAVMSKYWYILQYRLRWSTSFSQESDLSSFCAYKSNTRAHTKITNAAEWSTRRLFGLSPDVIIEYLLALILRSSSGLSMIRPAKVPRRNITKAAINIIYTKDSFIRVSRIAKSGGRWIIWRFLETLSQFLAAP